MLKFLRVSNLEKKKKQFSPLNESKSFTARSLLIQLSQSVVIAGTVFSPIIVKM